MFSMYRNSKSDVQRWILLQKDPSRVPVHHISSSTREYKEPRVSSPILNRHERIHVRDLTISNSDNINLAYELSRYPNLKYLCIHNLRVDDHLPQISATKIRIARSEKFNKVRFFQCFDVTRITSLNLENASLGIVPLAPEFVSLRELTIKEDTEVMVIFASCLIANSLTSISIPSNPEIDTRPALNHHCGSLRFIKCDFDPSYIIRKNPYEAKKIFYRLISDFERFPKLEWAIHLGVALRVNKKRDAFAKVWFHPEEYPY
ncbi:uncharacterized protein J8A68_004696 [[Candida] subhashii]|uniref:Uncharacterized protein n=1 Tax=[Candida] subhashii TaxID=561895 RepID=A0A8J5QJT7_9ASCO|nr:uncharacterized protein J8A68_004696 [[Candida] subhashii]KAG7661748.1 hypothetical protein J8A68_004696 [[Candida] subhashii]